MRAAANVPSLKEKKQVLGFLFEETEKNCKNCSKESAEIHKELVQEDVLRVFPLNSSQKLQNESIFKSFLELDEKTQGFLIKLRVFTVFSEKS